MRRILPFLLLAIAMTWGCHRKPSVPTPPPVSVPPAPADSAPAAVTPDPIPTQSASLESAPLPKIITTPSNLELGDKNFRVGNYRQAAKAFGAFLDDKTESKDRDYALFHLGLSLALANDGSRDLRQVESTFRLLVAQFPGSIYKNQAAFILGLLAQTDKLRSDIKERDERIKKLSEELQVLKEIDLQRRPSRPKE